MFRAVDKWLIGYLRSVTRRPTDYKGPVHIMFCVADHFEPGTRGGLNVVKSWVDKYPVAIDGIYDSDGRAPQHTFFYPEEEYAPHCLDALSALCSKGYGEVEIHLHHRNDTAEGLRDKLLGFKSKLREKHGLLGNDADGRVKYGFIHGNWALCNSRPDADWCGVNNELSVLVQTGCYADFTLPSAPSPTQPKIVNAVYRAEDIGNKPRAHDYGKLVRAGVLGSNISKNDKNNLLLIQGPLALNWENRKWGIFPRLENGEIAGQNPGDRNRIKLWVTQHIHVQGRPEWIFIKVHTHGCVEKNRNIFLETELVREIYPVTGQNISNNRDYKTHYVTAREMYNIIRAAEDGKCGDPGIYRDYEISKPIY